MNEITKIAVKRTVDPMQELMNALFEEKGDIFISDKILKLIKTTHSYTMSHRGNGDVYNFHKRVQGTETLFSFLVTTGPEGNRVSELDCIVAEFGVLEKKDSTLDSTPHGKVFLMLQEE